MRSPRCRSRRGLMPPRGTEDRERRACGRPATPCSPDSAKSRARARDRNLESPWPGTWPRPATRRSMPAPGGGRIEDVHRHTGNRPRIVAHTVPPGGDDLASHAVLRQGRRQARHRVRRAAPLRRHAGRYMQNLHAIPPPLAACAVNKLNERPLVQQSHPAIEPPAANGGLAEVEALALGQDAQAGPAHEEVLPRPGAAPAFATRRDSRPPPGTTRARAYRRDWRRTNGC